MIQQKSIFKNLLAKGTLSIFNFLIPLLMVPYVYRVLNPETIGYIEYGTTLFHYFGLLGLLGIYNYGLREVSRYRENKIKVVSIYRNLFVIGIISNLFSFLLFLLFIKFFVKEEILQYVMFIYSWQLIAQVFYIEWMNEAYEDFKFITVKTIIIRVISVVAVFMLVRSPEDYLIYVFILFLVLFFNNIVSYIHAQKYIRLSFRDLFKNLDIKKYLPPLFFILILHNTNILYTIVDRTMLGIYSGPESVAFYSVGQKIADVTKILLLSVVFVTLPRLSYYLEEDKEKYVDGVQRLMRLMLMIVLPVSIGLFMLAEPIVLLFAGHQYLETIPSLRVFALRIIILGVESILYHQIIFLHRKEKVLVAMNLFCGGVNILLNYYFKDHLTPLIAIFTTVIAEIVFLSLAFFYIKKRLYISTGFLKNKNLLYVILSLLFIPVIYLFQINLENQFYYIAASIISCALIYLLGLYWTNDEIFEEVKKKIIKG